MAGLTKRYKTALRQKKYYQKNKESIKNDVLMRNYGIDLNTYNLIYNKQKGKCAICGIHQSELSKSLCVDHDHTTGEVRGLLCSNCNALLGYSKDKIDILKNAIKYLEFWLNLSQGVSKSIAEVEENLEVVSENNFA